MTHDSMSQSETLSLLDQKKVDRTQGGMRNRSRGGNLGIGLFLYPAPVAEPGEEEKKIEKQVSGIQFISMLERAQEGQQLG